MDNAGRDSREFLREVKRRADAGGYGLGNADVTIIAQAPKMAPHLPAMIANIAADLGVAESAISIKATTTEKMGYVGREEGISCHAVVLVEHR